MITSEWTSLVLRPAAMNITCSLVSIHPWTTGAGNQADSGNYLSPDNAVASLLPYLSGSEEKDIVALLFCASTAGEFLTLAQQFADALPLPEIGRMCRMASSRLSLAVSKMQLPARAATSLPAPVTLSTLTTRLMTQADTIARATSTTSLSSETLTSALNQFSQARKKALQAINDDQQALQKVSCPVWAFSCTGDTRLAATQIQKNIPHPERVFTAINLFAGDDLSSLREALYDTDDSSGA
ncbi:TPA: hypothetical protein U0V61_001543 [Escherichia coli]|nr:hypothetical protein [Escherichia coli]MED9702039.1 hypothetical protein [Escherichia coli]HAY0225358.1 hypothetical protein [Escherichia coli]HEL8017909.1 hypothetical protein [Escherichia coli]HEL8087137.1 hypothetical protein [Escherichia coli]